MAKQTVRKGSTKKDELERARRKLAKLELKLEVASEEQLQADVRGKQDIEQARLRAAQWQTKAAEKLERRRQQVARAEARLAELTGEPSRDAGGHGGRVGADDGSSEAPRTQSAAGNRAERALQALRELDAGPTGATLTQWSQAAGMSKTTLSRARTELVQRGEIAQNGADGPTPRYVLRAGDG